MDSDTRKILNEILDAIEAANHTTDGLHAHALRTDPRGSAALHMEIRAAQNAAKKARKSLKSLKVAP